MKAALDRLNSTMPATGAEKAIGLSVLSIWKASAKSSVDRGLMVRPCGMIGSLKG